MTAEPRSAPIPAAFPPELRAAGTGAGGTIAVDAGSTADLPEGSMRRVTSGDLDVLVAHTPAGVVAVDDRCPHMSAPLSIGVLDRCIVSCPLHEGQFDLCSGDVVRMPTTGGLDADGRYHPTWSPAGKEPKVDPPGKKAEARRLTRVRRLRYYPLRIVDGRIEVDVPEAEAPEPAFRPAIEVVEPDPSWPATFRRIRDRVAPALGPLAIAIEHVGSTSVPGLAAKPVIDVDVVVASAADVPAAIAALETLGYEDLGDLGVPDREAFRRPPGTERHNLYVCVAGGQGLRNHLALRDYLRSHPAAVAEYGALKRRLAAELGDIDAYVVAKTDLIVSFLRAAGIDEPTLAAIEAANRT